MKKQGMFYLHMWDLTVVSSEPKELNIDFPVWRILQGMKFRNLDEAIEYMN